MTLDDLATVLVGLQTLRTRGTTVKLEDYDTGRLSDIDHIGLRGSSVVLYPKPPRQRKRKEKAS